MSFKPIEKETFPKPTWRVFPDHTLVNIELADCDNAINGVCTHANTTDDCMNQCRRATNCSKGYFIRVPDGKNICVPLSDHESRVTYHALRHQQENPVFARNHISSTVFFNTDKYPFPPTDAYTVFYQDSFVLHHADSKLNIGISDIGDVTEDVVFTPNNDPIHLQLLPGNTQYTYVQEKLPVRHGDMVVINIPGTAYVLRKDLDTPDIQWMPRASVLQVPSNTFQIVSLNPERKNGDTLSYDDQLAFLFDGQYVLLITTDAAAASDTQQQPSPQPALQVSSSSVVDLQQATFTFVPKFSVYYCAGKSRCMPAPADQARTALPDQTFYRDPECWNICDDSSFSSVSKTAASSGTSKNNNGGSSTIHTAVIYILVAIGCILFFIAMYKFVL